MVFEDIWLVVIGMVVGEQWASVVAVEVEVVALVVVVVVDMKVAWVEEEEAA